MLRNAPRWCLCLGKKVLTYEDLKEKYRTKGFELSLIFGFFRLEIFLTNLLLKSNISANQITMFSFILGILGCIFFSLAQQFLLSLGAILWIVWAFLDYIDGNIARAKKMTSNVGGFLDLVNSHVIGIFTLVSMGMALNKLSIDQGQSLLLEFIPRVFIVDPLIIGLIGGLAYAMKRFLKAYFLLIIGEHRTESQPSNWASNSVSVRKSVLGKILYIGRGLIEFPRSYTIVVAISLSLNQLYIWLYLVSIAFIMDTLKESIYITKKLISILTHKN